VMALFELIVIHKKKWFHDFWRSVTPVPGLEHKGLAG